IDALVLGADRNLGARARITRRPHHLDQLFGNFRHFNAEQLDQHLRRGTRQNQLRAAVLGANFLEQRTNTSTYTEGFACNDVLASQQRFGVVAQIDNHAVAGNLFHRAGDDFTQTITVGLDDLRALSLTNFLHDDLLGGLGGDTTELDGLDLLFEHIANLGVGLAGLLHIDRQLMCRIVEILFFDHSPATERFVTAVLSIDLYTQVNFVLETLFGSRGQSQLQRLENHTGRYAFFVGYRFHNQQYFFAHRTPRLSQSIGVRGNRVLLKTGNNICLVDHIDRQQILVIINQHHHILLFHPAKKTLEISPPLKGRSQFYF